MNDIYSIIKLNNKIHIFRWGLGLSLKDNCILPRDHSKLYLDEVESISDSIMESSHFKIL